MKVWLAYDRREFYSRAHHPILLGIFDAKEKAVDHLRIIVVGGIEQEDEDVEMSSETYLQFNDGDYFVTEQVVL